MKIYAAHIIENNQSVFDVEFLSLSARESFNSAMEFAEKLVAKGKLIKITCEGSTLWESKAQN